MNLTVPWVIAIGVVVWWVTLGPKPYLEPDPYIDLEDIPDDSMVIVDPPMVKTKAPPDLLLLSGVPDPMVIFGGPAF